VFKSILRSLGVGGARVETELDDAEVEVGGTLSGRIRVLGGEARQDIRGVVLELVTRARVEGPGDSKVLADILLGEARLEVGAVEPGQSRELPFAIRLPPGTPLSVGSTSTSLRTRLDVAGAVDSRDSDPVRVRPSRAMAAVLRGMEAAGFRLAEVEVEHRPRRAQAFVQEFDFRPRSSRDWGSRRWRSPSSPSRRTWTCC
jgi:sporulation-control protein